MRLTHEAVAMAFDCEGFFELGTRQSSTNPSGQQVLVRAWITQKYCDELLYTIAETLNFGKVTPGWRWGCQGKENVGKLLDFMQPWLIVNREQAKIVRGFLATIVGRGSPPTIAQLVLRDKLLSVWELNFSQKAKRERRGYAVDKGATGDLQGISPGQTP
jgi:hypothetical protein